MNAETGPSGQADEATRRAVGALYQPFAPDYDPAEFYARAHREAPVAYSEAFAAHLVTGHAEVTQVLRDPGRFSSARNLDPPMPLPPVLLATLERGYFPLAPALFNNDPPGHTRARALFARAFTPARIAALEPRIRRFAGERVEALAAAEGAGELMAALAFPLPMRVIAELIGVPPEDMPRLRAWQDGWFRVFDPGLPLDQRIADAEGFVAFQQYYLDLIARREAAPADDLVSALIRARVDGDAPFSRAELVSHLLILLFAGYETTASLIGSLVRRLLARPVLWQAIGGDPGLLAAAIEEGLRLDAPVQMEPRRTTGPTQLGGVRLPADATLYVFFGGANLDARVFPAPLQFDPRRPAGAKHMGFGHGVHACLGAALARLETRAALELLRARLPSLRLAPGATSGYTPSMYFRTPRAVPVAWDP